MQPTAAFGQTSRAHRQQLARWKWLFHAAAMRSAASVVSEPSFAARRRNSAALWLIAAVSLAYAFGHLAWYLGTPLGQVPVLDERENVILATQLAEGTLPSEPFYRAMVYPLVLAGFLRAGLSASQLVPVALVFGAILHALNAWLVGRLATRIFRNDRAGLIAAALAGLNPVLLHYAVSVLDATLASTFFLLGCNALFSRPGPNVPDEARVPSSDVTSFSLSQNGDLGQQRGPLLLAGFWWGLATLTRPQFLPVLLALPLITWCCWRTGSAVARGAAALVVGVLLLLAQGWWQRTVSGEFRVLPWQGTYNLWAANKPGAHGRYFVQSVFISANAAQENPTKLESYALYRQETGSAAPSVDALNAHWRTRFLEEVLRRPGAWGLLLARKTYALFNNWEQYNNKTYAFHQALSPWLRWNPLGWGLLLTAAIPGMWLLFRTQPRLGVGLLVLFALYASGLVLTFVSARFRLPLAAMLTVLAGGGLAQIGTVFSNARGSLFCALGFAAFTSFSRFDGVHDDRPFLQDHLLLSRAAQRTGDDALSLREAEAAAALSPQQPEAAELIVTSWFNLALREFRSPDVQVRQAAQIIALDPQRFVSSTAVLAGAVMAVAGDSSNAVLLWRELGTPEASAALILHGAAGPEEDRRLGAQSSGQNENVLIRVARLPATERPIALRRLFGTTLP